MAQLLLQEELLSFCSIGKDFFSQWRINRRQENIFHGQLYRAIKRKPWPGWRDDPEVRIE